MKGIPLTAVTYIRDGPSFWAYAPDFYKERYSISLSGRRRDQGTALRPVFTSAWRLISADQRASARGTWAHRRGITLRGPILPHRRPWREKTMARGRNGVNTVIIPPPDNEADSKEIEPLVRKALNFITTDHGWTRFWMRRW